jgi:hypothetical protein
VTVDGSDLAFALQTALRFGAGVGTPGAPPPPPAPALAPGLIRDAMAVFRSPGLQAHTGNPTPESPDQARVHPLRAQRAYQPPPLPEGPRRLDLLA